jgi:hypothetical protein
LTFSRSRARNETIGGVASDTPVEIKSTALAVLYLIVN